MKRPRKEDIPYIFAIVVTSIGILYNLFPLSTANVLILLGIDVLLTMAWHHSSVLGRIEVSLKREKFFVDRNELPRLPMRLAEAKKSIWIMAQSFGQLLGVSFRLLERCYEEGCEIRILLLNPKIVKNKMMFHLTTDILRSQLKASIAILRKYKGMSSEKGGVISGRLLPFETGFGLFIRDAEEPEGEIKVELQLKKQDPYEWPNVIITRKDPKRYGQLKEHFEALWEISDPI